MKEIFEKIKQRIMMAATEACGYTPITRVVSEAELKEIIEQTAAEYNNGWIPVEESLPEEPQNGMQGMDELPEYIVMIDGADQSTVLRYAGDGEWYDSVTQDFYKVIAWQPLPEPYQTNTCTETDCPYNDGKDCPAAVGCAGHELKEPCFHCDHTEQGDKRIPMTNGDLIRSMSDEELAMSMTCPNENESEENICDKREDYNCYECLLKWLQSEAER